jgi:DTW domain-containing protein
MSALPSMPSRRVRCAGCALPARTCLCALVTPVRNQVEVVVLQHPGEVDEAKGSVRLLRLSLARCRVAVGEVFEPDALLRLLDGDVSGAALLYPADTSTDVSAAAQVAPRRLVVLDGTWRKTLRMLHSNALLQALPRWAVPAATPSRYGVLRKARVASQLSTLEATCAALAGIEQAAPRYAPLQEAFGRFVADRAARARPPE